MIVSGNQNQFPSSFAPLGDVLKALMFLSNLNSFNSSPSPPVQGFTQRKGSSKVWKKKGSKWLCHFFPLLFLFFVCITWVFCFTILSQSSFMLCFVLTCSCLFVCFQFCFIFCFSLKKLKNQKNTKTVCVLCTLVLVYLGWPLKQSFFKLCIVCNLDEHLYAQLSKWALWLLFLMSMIKLSLILNTRNTPFDWKD